MPSFRVGSIDSNMKFGTQDFTRGVREVVSGANSMGAAARDASKHVAGMGDSVRGIGSEAGKRAAENVKDTADGMKDVARRALPARDALGRFVKTTQDASEATEKAAQDLKGLGRGLVTVSKALAVAGAAVSGFFALAVKSAADVEEAENLFTVAMGRMAASTREWSEELALALRLNANDIREVVGSLNVIVANMGFTEEAAASMSKQMTQLAFDMSSFYNLGHEEALAKLRSGIVGESEPLKQLGIIINETKVQAYAFANGIAEVGSELSDAQKVVARYGLIMEQTQKAQGDLARTADSATNQFRQFSAQVRDLMTNIGRELLPAVTAFFQRVNAGIGLIRDWAAENEALAGTLVRVGAGLGVATLAVSGITAALGTALIAHAALQTQAVKTAAATAAAWLSAAAPVVAFAALIAGIGAAIYAARAVFLQNLELIKIGAKQQFGEVANVFEFAFFKAREVADRIKAVFAEAWGFIANTFGAALRMVGIDTTNLTETIKGAATNLKTEVGGAFSTIFGGIKDKLSQGVEEWKSRLSAFGDALKLTWSSVGNQVSADTKSMFDSFPDWLQKFLSGDTTGAGAVPTYEPPDFAALLEGADLAGQMAEAAEKAAKGMKDLSKEAEEKVLENALRRINDEYDEWLRKQEAIQDSINAGQNLADQLTGIAVVRQFEKEIESLKTAGRLDDETANLLVADYWDEIYRMSDSTFQAMVASAQQLVPGIVPGLNEIRDAARFDEAVKSFDAVAQSAANLTSKLRSLGASALAQVVQRFATAVSVGLEMVEIFRSFPALFQKFQAAGISAAVKIGVALRIALNVLALIADAVQLVISLFGDWGKEGQKELKGMAKVIDEIKEASDQWVESLADAFVEFVKTGQQNWREFVQQILDDILRISTAELIIRPAVNTVGDFLGFAKGGAFSKGHYVDSPEYFNTKDGPAVRGEAGTEVVMPAVRLSDGTLGVKSVGRGGSGTVINVIDQRGANSPPLEIRERRGANGEQIKDIIIGAVREGFIKGDFDNSLSLIAPRLG